MAAPEAKIVTHIIDIIRNKTKHYTLLTSFKLASCNPSSIGK
jgi:hypothetical protein